MTGSAVLFLIIGVATIVFAEIKEKNVSLGKKAYQSSTHGTYTAYKGIDGADAANMNQNTCFHTSNEATNWWYVDCGKVYDKIKRIELYNRHDCCGNRAKKLQVLVGETLTNLHQVAYYDNPIHEWIEVIKITNYVKGRFVKLVHTAGDYFHLCEVRVYADVEKIRYG